MAIWADFSFGDGLSISTGPTKKILVGEKIEWDHYTRQGVHLIQQIQSGDTSGAVVTMVSAEVDFKVKSGDLRFAFRPSWSARS